jgi:hypothetical protein
MRDEIGLAWLALAVGAIAAARGWGLAGLLLWLFGVLSMLRIFLVLLRDRRSTGKGDESAV